MRRAATQTTMGPIDGFVRRGRKAQHVSLRGYSQPQDGPVGVGEVADYLVDFEDLSVVKARFSQTFDVLLRNNGRISGQGRGVCQGRQLFTGEGILGSDAVEGREDGLGAVVVLQQAAQTFVVVVYAVAAAVEHADEEAQGFQE